MTNATALCSCSSRRCMHAAMCMQMSIILVNLLVGPLLFRFALIRVGETKGQVALSTVHIHRDKEPSSGGATSNTGAPLPHETE